MPGWLTVLLRGLLLGSISCHECVMETAAHLKKNIEKEGKLKLQHGCQRHINDLAITSHKFHNCSRLP